MKVYDFDKTIYNGDSSVDFFLFSMFHHIHLWSALPIIALGFCKYFVGRISKTKMKEIFFMFLQKMNQEEYEETLQCFVRKNKRKIKRWYIKQMREDDVIITASPEFLVHPFLKELKNQRCIGTRMDIKTGKITGENCQGKQKTVRYREKFGNETISEFYTDSMSDVPLMEIAEISYLVRGMTVVKVYLHNSEGIVKV